MSKMVVAIWMVTYNHEQYIKAAIDSVLMQKTNFVFHLFIGEDCSTDNTRQIINYYAIKYPDKITLYTYKNNIGATQNGQIIYKACFDSGAKYIAMLEGDDYWTDSNKLQKQVDFLEANPDYVACFHDVYHLHSSNNELANSNTIVPLNYETPESIILKGNYIHTASLIFRNELKELPIEFSYSSIGDYFLQVLLAEKGLFKYLDERMAVYRLDSGIFNSKDYNYKQERILVFFMLLYNYYFSKNKKFSALVKKRIKQIIADPYFDFEFQSICAHLKSQPLLSFHAGVKMFFASISIKISILKIYRNKILGIYLFYKNKYSKKAFHFI